MCVLALYERPEVVNQPIERPSPHPQDVVKHVRRVDVKQVFLKPASGSRLHIPSSIHNTNVPRNEVQKLLCMWVLERPVGRCAPCGQCGNRCIRVVYSRPLRFLSLCKLCSACFGCCYVHSDHEHANIYARHNDANDGGHGWCNTCWMV